MPLAAWFAILKVAAGLALIVGVAGITLLFTAPWEDDREEL